MPRPKGSKNKVKRANTNSAAEIASVLAEKTAEREQLNGDIASLLEEINSLKTQLKKKRSELKSVEKAVAKLEAKKTAEEAKATQNARKAEIDSALQKLIADGMSVDDILIKLAN